MSSERFAITAIKATGDVLNGKDVYAYFELGSERLTTECGRCRSTTWFCDDGGCLLRRTGVSVLIASVYTKNFFK